MRRKIGGSRSARGEFLESQSPAKQTMSDTTTSSYRVLARKYRPATFDDLIGQDAMVRTISNAFEAGRIPQAWILTGVRGVGKTTTARILARALNYELPNGSIAAPTINMPVLGVHCEAIMESRHLDVIEMDAASHNSVDDVRQINDAIRYAPVSARYKVYILDEVHMLSGAAFNALLKTLEEPPPHAKFIFATTEIRKVPITVLSRCQRFDLRRVDAARLVEHLQGIAGKEAIKAEPEALALIARAAEGSVRDALSLFDQAIAHAGAQLGVSGAAASPVHADDVRQMLGLADRTRIIELFDALMRADVAAALKELRDQYDSGADPAMVLGDLAEFTHFVTRVKIVPSLADDVSLTEAERLRGRAFAAKLSMRILARTWQMLLKGIAEVEAAGRPIDAAEMVLVRIAYAADLPTPDEVIRTLGDARRGENTVPNSAPNSTPMVGTTELRAQVRPEQVRPEQARSDHARQEVSARGSRGPVAAATPMPVPAPAPIETPSANAGEIRAVKSFEDLIGLAAEKRDLSIKSALERDVRLVRFEDGALEIALEAGARKTLIGEISKKLADWTGRRWMVAVSAEAGSPSLRAQAEMRKAEMKDGVRGDPLVQAVMERFPGAEIVDVRPSTGTASEPANETPSGSQLDGDTADDDKL
ncbi:MAG TPA: DNA polymerase III subunit gamma/tau [Xanthobacteraceae bacterium]|nr:DNA polymerase III subunit gamma/tau [Xanthobacteraceae bacterium]